jgi:hypothetical protein
MVGKRYAASKDQSNGWMSNGGANGHIDSHANGNGNGKMNHAREHGNIAPRTKPKPAYLQFRDDSQAGALNNRKEEDQRREDIKNKLIDSVDRHQFEEYRKSDEFLKSQKNNTIRRFYEGQNEALNDWLEVDTAVRSIADDILESFDPDRDHDGIQEGTGALQAEGEDVEAFLPEEEREKRRKENKRAKLAINVGWLSSDVRILC